MYEAAFIYICMLTCTHNMCSSSDHWKGMEIAILQHPLAQILISKYYLSFEEMMVSRAVSAKAENKPRTLQIFGHVHVC